VSGPRFEVQTSGIRSRYAVQSGGTLGPIVIVMIRVIHVIIRSRVAPTFY
jgi:hypothetical protein